MMNQKRRILIVSMTGGFGHIRAGEALLDYAKEHVSGVQAEHVDISNMNPLLKKITVKLYDTASKKLPFLWGTLYKLMDVKLISFILKKIGGINYSSSRKIKDYILKKNPDEIIFTNVIPLPLFNAGFRKNFTHTKMGVVVTDYHGHPYYNFPWLDYYFVAAAQVKEDLENIGVPKEKVTVTGIPINPRFYVQENISDLKLKYGIKNEFPVVLLIVSFRISKKDLVETTRQLLLFAPRVNVVCLTNGNAEFYQILSDNFKTHERFFSVNWTNVIEEYIKMADVVITKAGGLTVSECLSLRKPLIMVNPIPGQEEHNAEFVEKNNFGVKARHINEIINLLPKMILQAKNTQMLLIPHENPCEKIFEHILK